MEEGVANDFLIPHFLWYVMLGMGDMDKRMISVICSIYPDISKVMIPHGL